MTEVEPPPRRAVFLRVFPLIALPILLSMVDQSIVATALPEIARTMEGGSAVVWVMVTYLMAAALSAPVFGRIADAKGRREILVVAVLLAMSGSLLCAMSQNFAMLLASRALQGMGGGAMHSVAMALVNQSVPARERARYQGFIASLSITANMAGPLIGAVLSHHLGWRSVFLLTPPLGLVAIYLVLRLPRSAAKGQRFRFDLTGFALLAVTVVSLLTFLFLLRPPLSAVPVTLLALPAVTVLAAAVFVRTERRAAAPLVPPALLVHPALWRANLLALCQGAQVGALIAFVPLYFSTARGVAQQDLGWAILPMTIGLGLGATIWGQVVGRSGRTAAITMTGMVLTAALLAGLTLLSGGLGNGTVSLLLGAVSFGIGSIMVVVQVTVSATAGEGFLGIGAGLVNLCRNIGAALGTALAGVALSIALDRLAGPGQAGALAAYEPAIISRAFAVVFATVCGFSVLAFALAATLPMRRIS